MDNENNTVEETVVDNNVIVGNEVIEEITQEAEDNSRKSEESFEFTDTSNNEDVEETVEEPKKETRTYTEEEHQSEIQRIIDKVVARERRKGDEKIKPLLNTLKAGGFETDDPVELENKIRQSYEEQGVKIPNYINSLSDREQKALAKVDAEEIIELGNEAMKDAFAELYKKPDKSIREEEVMYLIGKENSTRLAKRDLIELGAEPDKVLNDSKFKEFASKMASNISVKEIYQLYQKVNGEKPQAVPTAGSVKNNTSETETFTQAKIDNMTPQEMIELWNNPEFRKIAKL